MTTLIPPRSAREPSPSWLLPSISLTLLLVHTGTARARAQEHPNGMAGSSSDPIGGGVRHHESDDPSLALALRLQEEEDAALALSLQEADLSAAASPQPQPAMVATPDRGRLPGELLVGPAHKAVQHLGRGTAKKIEVHMKQQPLTLRDLLRLFNGPRREELLGLVDAGQRQRVEAELVALSLDFPAG